MRREMQTLIFPPLSRTHVPPQSGQNAALVGKSIEVIFIQPQHGAAVVGKRQLAQLLAARRRKHGVHIVAERGGAAVADDKRREQDQRE